MSIPVDKSGDELGTAGDGALRLDKWLWFARFFKTRSGAAAIVAGGGVSLDGRVVARPAQPVRVGDTLCFPTPTGGRRRVVRVLGLGTRRGPAPEARRLYQPLDGDGAPDRDAED